MTRAGVPRMTPEPAWLPATKRRTKMRKGLDASRVDWMLDEPDDEPVCDSCGEPGGGNCPECDYGVDDCDGDCRDDSRDP